MRGKGITYDTGFFVAGTSTHEPFGESQVKRDLRAIRDDLHCTAVRVTGGDPGRLEVAATYAANLGLEVWVSPFTCDLTADELLDVLADCTESAEELRRQGAQVVVVTGAELSLFTCGFLPGDTVDERLALLAAPGQLREPLGRVPSRINAFLGMAVSLVRERFRGKVTYASIPFEGVDWTPFDFVGVDAYRSIEVAVRYRASIRALVAKGKPVAITEFGCATYRGAADAGARGGMIVDWDRTRPIRLKGDFVRDEEEQAGYLRELLDIFNDEGIDSAFVCTFASYNLPHDRDARKDWDLASFGVVKVLDEPPGDSGVGRAWARKAGFDALADYYC